MAKNVVSLLMGKLNKKITIQDISKLLKMEPGNCRIVIARVRKIRPVYAEQDGSGYMANLEVLKRYA